MGQQQQQQRRRRRSSRHVHRRLAARTPTGTGPVSRARRWTRVELVGRRQQGAAARVKALRRAVPRSAARSLTTARHCTGEVLPRQAAPRKGGYRRRIHRLCFVWYLYMPSPTGCQASLPVHSSHISPIPVASLKCRSSWLGSTDRFFLVRRVDSRGEDVAVWHGICLDAWRTMLPDGERPSDVPDLLFPLRGWRRRLPRPDRAAASADGLGWASVLFVLSGHCAQYTSGRRPCCASFPFMLATRKPPPLGFAART